MADSKKSGKNRKIGRNKKDATLYAQQNRLEKNKKKSLARHLKRMGLDPEYLDGYTAPGGPAHPRSVVAK
jgi:hypothetical protein